MYCTAPAFVLLQPAAVLPTRAAPFTSSDACGDVVPMPTEPDVRLVNKSEPPVLISKRLLGLSAVPLLSIYQVVPLFVNDASY